MAVIPDSMLIGGSGPALRAPDPPPPAAMAWRSGEQVTPLVDTVGQGTGWCDLGRFVSWLREAQVVDGRAVDLPGVAVTLPYGCKLLARLEAIIRKHYTAFGYEEYDYPLVAPAAVMEPASTTLGLDNALLYFGDDRDWRQGRRRGILTPTGEAMIYAHWARMTHSADTLPIKMFRKARYFRPVRAGQGVFKPLEAPDIFEFQACHPDPAASRAAMFDALEMVSGICEDVHLPVLWSTRPPWTNHGAVAETTIGGDVPLPHGGTVQVGCIYDQSDRFSRAYGVRWRDGADWAYTHHVTGCVSRRLLLSHIFLGMSSDGEMLLHPDLAPTQVGVTLANGNAQDHAWAAGLVEGLTAKGLRTRLEITADKQRAGKWQRLWRRQGVPLVHEAFDARSHPAAVTYAIEHIGGLVDRVPSALAEIGAGYAHRAYNFAVRQCASASAEDLREVLARRAVAVCPLAPTEAVTRHLASWRLGEVLGFRRLDRSASCVVTGETTSAIGYVSPRT